MLDDNTLLCLMKKLSPKKRRELELLITTLEGGSTDESLDENLLIGGHSANPGQKQPVARIVIDTQLRVDEKN